MKLEDQEAIKLKIMDQQRKAYEIAKYLRSTLNTPIVSYVISTAIVLQQDKYIPITTVKQLPDTIIHHNKTDAEEEFIKYIDIENIRD